MTPVACAHCFRLVSDTFGTRGSTAADPFGTPFLIIADTVRTLCLVLAGVGYVGVVVQWRRVDLGKRLLLVGMTLAMWSILETEWDAIGTPVGGGGRLWVNFVAAICFVSWARTRMHPRTKKTEL